jgi:multicomponent Na+:H+ antiporter subunit G
MLVLGWAICVLGISILLIAAVGIIVLPDALARQHAATKAATLAVSLFALGQAVVAGDASWTWRLIAMVTILSMTLPLASHAIARAGARELGSECVRNVEVLKPDHH